MPSRLFKFSTGRAWGARATALSRIMRKEGTMSMLHTVVPIAVVVTFFVLMIGAALGLASLIPPRRARRIDLVRA